ncbi:hypothetical protein [Modestobacter sp. NPDC049651]|uniref:hypothetical protein n=1 Tax=unclassified Modestobacter TaxID=2643866 RepID=UPI00340F63E5
MNRRAVVRAASAVAAVWGAVLLVAPERVTRAVAGGGPEPRAWVVRLLGGRLVAQHGLVLLRPSRAVVLLGVGVDTVHAASMVALAAALPRYRRAAEVSGGTSLVSAAVGALAAPVAQR